MEFWDVFVSHASEDKEEVARPLAKILEYEGFTVWVDEEQILLGNSLLKRIQEGISHSRFGVIILSHAYFSDKKKWTKEELSALWSLETNSNIILPILHKLSLEDLKKYYPILIDRVYVSTENGIQNVGRKIAQAIRGNSHQDELIDIKYHRGQYFMMSLQMENALKEFSEILEIDPSHYRATIFKGMALKRANRLDEAIQLLNDIAIKWPNRNETYYNRACYQCLLRHPINEVLKDLREAIRLYPPNKDYALNDPDFDGCRDEIIQFINGLAHKNK